MDCLTTPAVVGITKTDCPCVVDYLDEETREKLAESSSGLYLDQLEGAVNLRQVQESAEACEDFATMSIEARDEAIKVAWDELIVGLGQKMQKKTDIYTGNLGFMSVTRPYTPSRPVVGMLITPTNAKSDAIMRLTGISLITYSAITTAVKLYKSVVGGSVTTQVGADMPITTVAGQYTPVPNFTAFDLPLYENGQRMAYYIEYDRLGSMPMDIRPYCGCAGVERVMKSFVSLAGFEADAYGSLPVYPTEYTGGVVAHVTIQCKTGNFICREYKDNDPVAIMLAHAIRYKAGQILMNKILSSTEINRFTMLSRESLYGKRNHFEAEYNKRMQFLPETVHLNSSDCFVCTEAAKAPQVTLLKM